MANFPLINEASLVMASGAYKEGKIYSQLPTDGSGDFTFTRGTDTATRVNKDGYIEKERANLLLQSNQFDTSPWVINTSVSEGEEGYDGTTDAWSLTRASGGSLMGAQNISLSGVSTYSIYAKINTNNGIGLAFGSLSIAARFDLRDATKTQAVTETGIISSSQKYVGNGFYRLSITANVSGSIEARIYLTTADATTSDSSGGTHIIQDAQVEQGLVATDYIETTTAPVYAGLTDNMPRLDYSGGAECGAYLLEESRTNIANGSEYFGGLSIIGSPVRTPNATISPEGVKNAYAISVSGGSARLRSINIPYANGDSYCFSVYAKANGTSTFNMIHQNNKFNVRIDLSNQTYTPSGTNDWLDDVDIVPFGNGWYRCVVYITMDANAVTGTAEIQLLDGDSVYVYGIQIEQGSYPTSYIPTYGSTQTRAADVSTVSKTLPSEGSLFINVGGTSQPKLSVLGEYFDASTTANKVAIAYSSTALVISHNGSIVVDKTGTYDVSSLTQIQLGHSNGADQADSPISEFITFDSFLTNNELNALTQ